MPKMTNYILYGLYFSLGGLGVFMVAVVIGGWYFSEKGYSGPLSDNFDGKVFVNPGGIKDKSTLDVIKWMLNRDQGEWAFDDEMVARKPAKKIFGEELEVSMINHSTLLIQTQGFNILTDPVYSDRVSPFTWAGPKRMTNPGITFNDLPKIDVVLISHNHYDHLDLETLKRINDRDNPKIILPLGVGALLQKHKIGNWQELDWWHSILVDDGFSIHAVPAQHFSGRGLFDRNKTLWAGFVLEVDGGNIYFAGDTGLGNFFNEIGERFYPLRLALFPIGAYKPEWFMSPVHTSPPEGLQIVEQVNARFGIPIHFGTFPLADDGQFDPETALNNAINQSNINENRINILKNGEYWKIPQIKNSLESDD
jgi:L-ascorbate metabolism protein UlaG (beta-lactamase superfamily)